MPHSGEQTDAFPRSDDELGRRLDDLKSWAAPIITRRVARWLERRGGSVEEIWSDACTDVLRRFRENDFRESEEPSFQLFVLGAIVHAIDSFYKSVTREKRDVGREIDGVDWASRLAESMTTPSMNAHRKEVAERVRSALLHLPPHEREILCLHYLDGTPQNQIAEMLELSPATISKVHYRVLQRLAPFLRQLKDVV